MRKLLWDYKRSFVGLPFLGTIVGQVATFSFVVLIPAATLYAVSFRPYKRVFYDVHDSTLAEK